MYINCLMKCPNRIFFMDTCLNLSHAHLITIFIVFELLLDVNFSVKCLSGLIWILEIEYSLVKMILCMFCVCIRMYNNMK